MHLLRMAGQQRIEPGARGLVERVRLQQPPGRLTREPGTQQCYVHRVTVRPPQSVRTGLGPGLGDRIPIRSFGGGRCWAFCLGRLGFQSFQRRIISPISTGKAVQLSCFLAAGAGQHPKRPE